MKNEYIFASLNHFKMANNVDTIRRESYSEAAQLASERVSETGGRSFPVTIFNQGERTFISAVFPVQYIINELKTNATERDRGVKDVRQAMNRPLDVPHARSTKDYIKRNFKTKYILPPMTLNIQDSIEVITYTNSKGVSPALMVIPYGVKFSITDGQHRKRALEDLAKDLSEQDYNILMNHGICVMITIEDDLGQIHQDFADCSKTKPLPKSLIAVYDRRNPANSIVMDLIEACPLFKNKVDATRQTLSKKSVKLMLVSQVRSLVKELCLGNSATGDADFEKRMIELFIDANTDTYKNDVGEYIYFINSITKAIPVLNEVSLMQEGAQMTKIPSLREKYLILNSAGLNIVGRIIREILVTPVFMEQKEVYIARLGEIDWSKDAEIWKGNIVAQGAKGLKISNSNSTLKQAVQKVKDAIGLVEQEKTPLLL